MLFKETKGWKRAKRNIEAMIAGDQLYKELFDQPAKTKPDAGAAKYSRALDELKSASDAITRAIGLLEKTAGQQASC